MLNSRFSVYSGRPAKIVTIKIGYVRLSKIVARAISDRLYSELTEQATLYDVLSLKVSYVSHLNKANPVIDNTSTNILQHALSAIHCNE
jgi:hypothetical protein